MRLDRTRVASIQFGSIAARFLIPELGLAATTGNDGASNNGSDHHSYTHHKGGDVWRFMDWYALRISSLLRRLQGDGSQEDMLNRGVVMTGTESGQVHTAHDIPVTLFGSCGGYYNEGTTLTYGNDADGMKKHTGTLLSLAHAMGVTELESFGHPNPAYHAGVPEGLRK